MTSGTETQCKQSFEYEAHSGSGSQKYPKMNSIAKPDSSPPDYPSNCVFIIVNLLLNWFACVPRIR